MRVKHQLATIDEAISEECETCKYFYTCYNKAEFILITLTRSKSIFQSNEINFWFHLFKICLFSYVKYINISIR